MITTKQQEREALEQIRNILNTLESGSYVRTAYQGIDVMAESNIDNDFGISATETIRHLETESEELKKENKRLEQEIKNILQIEEVNKKTVQRLHEEHDKGWNLYDESTGKLNAAATQLKEKDQEILELKARLFDYMTLKAS